MKYIYIFFLGSIFILLLTNCTSSSELIAKSVKATNVAQTAIVPIVTPTPICDNTGLDEGYLIAMRFMSEFESVLRITDKVDGNDRIEFLSNYRKEFENITFSPCLSKVKVLYLKSFDELILTAQERVNRNGNWQNHLDKGEEYARQASEELEIVMDPVLLEMESKITIP